MCCLCCLYFVILIALAKSYSMTVHACSGSGYPWLVPDLPGTAFSLSPFTMTSTGCFLHMDFVKLRCEHSVPDLWRVLIMIWCWISSNSFSVSMDDGVCWTVLASLEWMLDYGAFLMFGWIWLTYILLNICTQEWPLKALFKCVFVF